MAENEDLKRQVAAIDRKLEALQAQVTGIDKEQAVLRANSAHIEAQLAKILGNVSKLLWLVGGVIAAAAVKFVLEGGLANVG